VKETESEEMEEESEATEEARRAVAYRSVKKPSRQQVEAHNVTHMPYEPWCPDCVRGQGLGARHVGKSPKDEELRVPTLAAD
jgi:hypothetical protein